MATRKAPGSTRKSPRASGAASAPAKKRVAAKKAAAKGKPRERARPAVLRISAAERERRFNLIVQTACLKAGTAAAIGTLTSKVPILGKLAPVVLGAVAETAALGKIQQQMVRDIMALYEMELTEPEERGVILLATAANIGAQKLSKTTVEQLARQLTGRLYRPVIAQMLPIASLVTEIAASVASTYAVGKRAQALCLLPGTGVRNLGELLRGLSGIDQTRLFKWSAEAFNLAISPFRRTLAMVLPGFGPDTR